VATCDRLSFYYNLTYTVSSAWQDEHLKFLGGFIVVLFLRDHDVLINMIYDHVRAYRKEKNEIKCLYIKTNEANRLKIL